MNKLGIIASALKRPRPTQISLAFLLAIGFSGCVLAQGTATNHRRIPYVEDDPPDHRDQLTTRAYRDGRLLWHGRPITMQVLRDYLRRSQALDPLPYLVLEYETGIDNAMLANLRRLFDEDGGCNRETLCSERQTPARQRELLRRPDRRYLSGGAVFAPGEVGRVEGGSSTGAAQLRTDGAFDSTSIHDIHNDRTTIEEIAVDTASTQSGRRYLYEGSSSSTTAAQLRGDDQACIRTTIAALGADPGRYDGHRVCVSGFFGRIVPHGETSFELFATRSEAEAGRADFFLGLGIRWDVMLQERLARHSANFARVEGIFGHDRQCWPAAGGTESDYICSPPRPMRIRRVLLRFSDGTEYRHPDFNERVQRSEGHPQGTGNQGESALSQGATAVSASVPPRPRRGW